MNKNKKIFIITITFLMLVGLTTIAATDIDNNDTTTITQTSQTNTIDTTTETKTINKETSSTKEASTSQTNNIQETTNTQETINNKNGEKTQNLKASRTVSVSTFNELNNTLTSDTYDTVTIDINDDIQLAGNIIVNNTIKTLTINGNGKTIDGNNQHRFLYMSQANFILSNITITQCNSIGKGGAIYGNNSNITLINSTLTNNKVTRSGYGGSVYVEDNSNIIIISSFFINNTADVGGAISCSNYSEVSVTNNSFFINNTAKNGGAIYVLNKSNVIVFNSSFSDNNATSQRNNVGGGAIYGTEGNITVINSSFTNNTINKNTLSSIEANGGAIYGTSHTNINIINSSFTNNYINNGSTSACGGGAICGDYTSPINIFNSYFINNTIKGYGYGGAIRGSANNFIINNSFFENNTALTDYTSECYGGAIFVSTGGHMTVINSSFTNNKANEGGAISGWFDITITVIDSSFTNNSLNNATTTEHGGGAIHGYYANITIINSSFTDNHAPDDNSQGGAIYGTGHTNISIINSSFINNHAVCGGAIAGQWNSNITIINSVFKKNHAIVYYGHGGAIYGYDAPITIMNCSFENNTSDSHGGAIRGRNCTIINSSFINNHANSSGAIRVCNSTIINCSFINNIATNGSGGAIVGDNCTIINCSFINNTATRDGGAIWMESFAYKIKIVNSNFVNNTASLSGGAIYVANTYSEISLNILDLINSTFANNTANTNGGAIYGAIQSNISITNSNITNNNAGNIGGAIYGTNNITITNTNITNNNANSSGGAIVSNGNLTITNTNITNNNATQYGGAISGSGNMTITNTNITNNNAKIGGAISNYGNLTITNTNITNNNATQYGGAIYSTRKITITQSNITNNSANEKGGAIYGPFTDNITITNSELINNFVTSNNGYVVDFTNVNSVIITDNTFINNTDNTRDMLFSDAKTSGNVDIHGNTYIDNFLEDTIIQPNVTVVTDNEAQSYDYYVDLNLREVYNDTVRNGTLNVYVNGVLKDTINVTSGRERILFGNGDLTKRENNITLEYITLSKHYQNTSTSLILYKEVNTTLSIQAPSTMNAGETALINFTLKDVNNNPISGETIHVLVNEKQNATITTDNNGIATYTFNARGDDLVRIVGTHHTSNDSFYLNAKDAEAKIDVNKIEPEIFIEHGNITPQIETNITIHLFDTDGKPIKNKTLTVNITEKGKADITGTVKTDENGIALFNFRPVDEGILNITVTSPSDDIYHYASRSVQASKNFITTNMIVTASSMKINQTNTINVEVLSDDGALLNGIVELDIDGDIHTLNITNGRGTYHDYKSETASEKLVTAKFISNTPGYANSTTTEEFNVGKLPTRVTIETVNRTAGNVTLKILVFPEDDIASTVNGGNIVIESINGENRIVIYNNTLENGELIYLTNVNETGWYEFATEYFGNDYFLGEVDNTGSLEVLPLNTSTVTYDKTARVGDKITLNATVTDADGNPVNDGTITFIVDKIIEAKIENGIATTEYTLPITLTQGNYTIKANYPGNNKYNASAGEAKLSIELHETSMNVNILNDTKGNTTIEVTLNTTPDNKPISGAEIIITDKDGNPIGEGTTNKDGVAIITIDIPVGDNDITISYPGDEVNSPQEETKTVNVTPRESQTTATINNNTVGNVSVEVQVLDPVSGEPVTGPVNIIIDGQIVGNGTLDDEGRATIPVDLDKKGNYTIVVEYEGNDDYEGSNDTLEDLYIKGKDVDMDVIIDNPVVGETEVIVTIVDPETGEPIPNTPVVVTLPNGDEVTGTTGEDGSATIPVNLPSGDNTITITYPGDDTHEDKEVKNTIRVKSYSVITVDPVEGVALDNVTFTANVHDYQDKPVTGGYVQFNVGGKTLKDENGKNIRVLVENGIAKLSYKAESGWLVDSHPNLNVQAVYTGTSMALANRSDTSKVTINKRNATVTVSAPDDYVNGTLHIDAVVRDQNGSLINDGNLVFKLNGLSVKDENNKGIIAQVKNGKVQLSVKLPFAYSAKKYNLTAVYSNKIYNKATGTNTTTLKAIPTYINAIVSLSDQYSKPVITGQIYNKNNNAILQGTAILNIKFDGISYAKKVKVNNGTFRETLDGISIYKPGTHKVEVTVGANSHYEGLRETYTTQTTAKYNATPIITSITRNKTTTRIQAKIVDDRNKNAQKNLKITIKVNGLSFLVNQTVRNGKVDVLVDTSTLKNRTYNLELVSGANTYYNAGKATAELPKY